MSLMIFWYFAMIGIMADADNICVSPVSNPSASCAAIDSPNDAPMFAFFEHSVGVANVARFEGALEAEPKYVTRAAAGAGFAELAARLLAHSQSTA